jgi:hypothetical protein
MLGSGFCVIGAEDAFSIPSTIKKQKTLRTDNTREHQKGFFPPRGSLLIKSQGEIEKN